MSIDQVDTGMAEILHRLKTCRVGAGITLEQAAAHIGLKTSSAVCDIEAGRNPLSVERLMILCTLYKTSPVWILMGREECNVQAN